MKRLQIFAAIIVSAIWPVVASADPGETPTTEAPTTEAPVTEAPATEPPATEAPMTEAPVTEAPAPGAPVTGATAIGPTSAITGTAPGETLPNGTVAGEKSVWATGLRGPQGMARDAQGNVYAAEYDGGQIAKFSPNGNLLARIGTDLQNPAWIERAGATFYVTERKANRILRLNADGTLSPVMGTVEEPLGLAADTMGRLMIVSHTTSQLLVLPPGARPAPSNPNAAQLGGQATPAFVPLYVAPAVEGKRYGYRCIAVDRDGTLFFTDETDGQLMLRTPAGRVAVWVRNLNDPTAVVISPDGSVFVAEEGAGRISRVNAEGTTTLVADGLGQPRDIEFLDGKTLLVSDRQGGVIWKVTLP